VYEVKNKISTLKYQYRRECRDRENKSGRKSSKLWCYEMLTFLKESSNPKKCDLNIEEDQNNSDENTENLWISYEADSDTDKKEVRVSVMEHEDDIFDTIGKNIAMKLRDMDDDQRMYAENLINEVLYLGLMGKLTVHTRLSLNGD